MENHLDNLNNAQREAAMHTHGPLLIVAGAGAGKTKTITHRIVNLIKQGIAPDKILAVTFTNKAAKEMRERIMSELGKNFPLWGLSQADEPRGGAPRTRGDSDPKMESFAVPFVSTFHSLGVYIIKENARLLGLTKYFSILDEGDANSMIKDILKELGIDPKQYEPRKIKGVISREKGKFTEAGEFARDNSTSNFGNIVAKVWHLYEQRKAKENSLDFDDLLLKATQLLKENESVRSFYQDKWHHIHIDEYQDTNQVQYLMSRLLSEKHKNICVVGDADQNIYSWRGANLKNILNFEKDYPNATIILLEQNYRSTQNILEAANEIIKKNKYRPEKNLFTKNREGEKLGLYEAIDETDEADFVATKILEIQDTSTAVLYRANFQSRALEEAMLKYNIPYQVLGIKFFERKEIKDTLAYLRAALNKENLADIKRIINFPARGIGKATLAKIFAGQIEDLPAKTRIKINNFYSLLEEIKEKIKTDKPSQVIKFVLKRTGIETELLAGGDEELERLENIKELATLALKYDQVIDIDGTPSGIEKLLEDASLASDQDSLINTPTKTETPAGARGVKLMTVHASKGLEFDYVFIVGLEDGLFPHEKQNEAETAEDREEERRLFYVAVTRARHKLFLSFANFRTIFGSRQINAPSEFISDLPAHLIEKEGEQGGIKTIYI